jgi:hypothetical protein
MYRRPKFLEVLLEIRQAMSREADYDIDLFVEMVRSGRFKERFDLENGQPKIEFPISGDQQQIADY